jgi:hypothetical protein
VQERLSRSHQGYGLVLQEVAFPAPVPIFAARRPNNEHEAQITIKELNADRLKMTDVLLSDDIFSSGLFLYLYEQAVDWALTSKQLSSERHSK